MPVLSTLRLYGVRVLLLALLTTPFSTSFRTNIDTAPDLLDISQAATDGSLSSAQSGLTYGGAKPPPVDSRSTYSEILGNPPLLYTSDLKPRADSSPNGSPSEDLPNQPPKDLPDGKPKPPLGETPEGPQEPGKIDPGRTRPWENPESPPKPEKPPPGKLPPGKTDPYQPKTGEEPNKPPGRKPGKLPPGKTDPYTPKSDEAPNKPPGRTPGKLPPGKTDPYTPKPDEAPDKPPGRTPGKLPPGKTKPFTPTDPVEEPGKPPKTPGKLPPGRYDPFHPPQEGPSNPSGRQPGKLPSNRLDPFTPKDPGARPNRPPPGRLPPGKTAPFEPGSEGPGHRPGKQPGRLPADRKSPFEPGPSKKPPPDVPETPQEPPKPQPEPEQPKPEQPKPDQPEPEQPKPDQPEPEQPKPDQPGEPMPDEPEKPTPGEPEKPTPGEPEKPTPGEPEKPTPGEPEKPTPKNPKQPRPKQPRPKLPRPKLPRPKLPRPNLPRPNLPKQPKFPKPKGPPEVPPETPSNPGSEGEVPTPPELPDDVPPEIPPETPPGSPPRVPTPESPGIVDDPPLLRRPGDGLFKPKPKPPSSDSWPTTSEGSSEGGSPKGSESGWRPDPVGPDAPSPEIPGEEIPGESPPRVSSDGWETQPNTPEGGRSPSISSPKSSASEWSTVTEEEFAEGISEASVREFFVEAQSIGSEVGGEIGAEIAAESTVLAARAAEIAAQQGARELAALMATFVGEGFTMVSRILGIVGAVFLSFDLAKVLMDDREERKYMSLMVDMDGDGIVDPVAYWSWAPHFHNDYGVEDYTGFEEFMWGLVSFPEVFNVDFYSHNTSVTMHWEGAVTRPHLTPGILNPILRHQEVQRPEWYCAKVMHALEQEFTANNRDREEITIMTNKLGTPPPIAGVNKPLFYPEHKTVIKYWGHAGDSGIEIEGLPHDPAFKYKLEQGDWRGFSPGKYYDSLPCIPWIRKSEKSIDPKNVPRHRWCWGNGDVNDRVPELHKPEVRREDRAGIMDPFNDSERRIFPLLDKKFLYGPI